MNQKIKILLFGSYLWYLGEGMFGPLLAIFTERVGGDILDISWAWATYLIVTGVVSIFVGRFSDHHSKKRLMIAGYALNAIATFGYLFVDSPFKLLFVQGFLGIASALATPTWDSLFSIYADKKYIGEEWGLSDGGPHIVTGIAIIIGGLIISHYSFSALFIMMGIIQIAATLAQCLIFFNKKDRKGQFT